MNTAPRLRAALLLAAFALLAWLLAQGCTLLWQAAVASARDAQVAAGQPLYAWEFGDPAAVVAPGSEGLDGATQGADGLRAADGAPVLDLSLALDGVPVAGQAYAGARLRLDTEVPARVLLLAPAVDGEIIVVGDAAVQPGEQAVLLPLARFAAAADWLRLRVERAASGRLVLHALALVEPRCAVTDDVGEPASPAECEGSAAWTLRPAFTPEAFLAARDAALRQAPAARVEVGGVPQAVARAWRLLHADWFHAMALLAAVLVLGWSVRARRIARMAGSYGGRPEDTGQPRTDVAAAGAGDGPVIGGNSRGSLVVLLAVPVVLLLAGQPDRHDHVLVLLALLASVAAALLHPGGRRDWRWVGDRPAWAAAARLTALGLAVVGAVALIGFASDQPMGDWRSARLPRYLAWALLQQALLLVAIMPRLVRGDRDPRIAAVTAGGIFALLHLPNFGLAMATLLAGSAWALQGHRHGALLPLALSHALLGTLLVWAASPWLIRSAEVGGRFLMPG